MSYNYYLGTTITPTVAQTLINNNNTNWYVSKGTTNNTNDTVTFVWDATTNTPIVSSSSPILNVNYTAISSNSVPTIINFIIPLGTYVFDFAGNDIAFSILLDYRLVYTGTVSTLTSKASISVNYSNNNNTLNYAGVSLGPNNFYTPLSIDYLTTNSILLASFKIGFPYQANVPNICILRKIC